MQSTGPKELIPHPPPPTPHPPCKQQSDSLLFSLLPSPHPSPHTQRPDRRAEGDRDKINGDRDRQTNKDREREGGKRAGRKKEKGRQKDTIQRESIGTTRKAISLKAHVQIFDRIRLFFKCIIYNVQIHAVGEVCTLNVYPRPFLFTIILRNLVYLSTAFFLSFFSIASSCQYQYVAIDSYIFKVTDPNDSNWTTQFHTLPSRWHPQRILNIQSQLSKSLRINCH